MTLHRAAALAALAAATLVPTGAQASTRRMAQTRTQEAELAAQLQQARQQLARLQARIDALEARLPAAPAHAAAPAPVLAPVLAQAAPATPAAPEAEPQTEPARLAAIKADKALDVAEKTRSALARTDKALSAVRWAADTTVSGLFYLNASAITQHTAGGGNAASGLGVNLKRAYLSVDHRFSRMWSANLTMDAENAFGQTGSGNPSTGSTQVIGKGFLVKKAYVEGQVLPMLTLRVGSADLPWIPYSEARNGLRHIEKSPVERVGYGNSADWGVHVLGDLYRSQDASISYAVSAVNGAGYHQLRVTRSVDVEARLSGTYHGIYAALGGYNGQRGNDTQAVSTTPSTYHTARRLDAALGYRGALGGIGAEYFYAKDWNNTTSNPALYGLSEDSASGWSIAADYSMARKWMAFARYDLVKPSEMTLPRLRDDYVHIGLQYSPIKPVSIALVYKHEVVKGGALATANGVIGCSSTATLNAFATTTAAAATCNGNGSYDEVGIFSQVRF